MGFKLYRDEGGEGTVLEKPDGDLEDEYYDGLSLKVQPTTREEAKQWLKPR